MANVTGQIGQENVILENAATEETLKKLLAALTTMNQSILKPAGGGGGTGAAAAAAGLTAVGVAAKVASTAFSMIGGVLGGLTNIVGAATGAFIGLAEQAMDNQAKMSDFYGALGKVAGEIPLFGGVLGGSIGLFQKMAAMQEKNLEQYQKLTTAGINFGGSLTNLRMAASNSYMSFEAFTDLMKKNSTTFAKMGGTVNDGAEAFAKMSHELIKSPIGDRLLALGYTTDQVNQGMADYINVTGGRNAQEMKNTKSVTAGAAAYMEQLDGLARLTGENREQLGDEMKKRAANAAWEAKLQGMTDEERKKATIGMANALAAGGEGAADAFQAQVMGVAVQTRAGQAFSGMYGAGAEKIRQSADMVYNGHADLNDMNKNLLDTQDTLAEEQKKYGSQTSFVLQTQGNDLGKASQAVQHNTNQVNQSTREAREAALKKKELSDTEAEEVARANKAMQEFGQQIMGFLTPIIKEMTPYMTGILDQFKAWFSGVDLPALGKQVGDVLKDVAEYLKNFISEEGRAKILNDIKYMFGLALIEIKKALYPLYNDKDAAKDKAKLDADKAVFDASADAAKTKIGLIAAEKALQKQAEADTEKTGEAGRKLAQTEIDRLKKQADDTLKITEAKKAALSPNTSSGGTLKGKVVGAAAGAVGGGIIGGISGAALGAGIGGTLGAIGGPLGVVAGAALGESFGTWLGGAGGVALGGLIGKNVGDAVTAPGDIVDRYKEATPANKTEKSLGDHLETLNKQTAEMIKIQKEHAEHAKKNVEATKSLNRNLWA